MGEKVYQPRQPQKTKLWQCLNNHFEKFVREYSAKYEKRYGYLRPIVTEVVNKYLECGDLRKGFVRVVCKECRQSYLLAFSCRGRWFCPSCHQKKVLQFGEFITQTVAYPVPHRQYVMTLPRMLRVYFKHEREMIGKLCQVVYESVKLYLREVLGKESGQTGMVIALQSFGEYLNAHTHIHAIVADGIFTGRGMFYVMPKVSVKWLEEIFRVKVIEMLVREGKIAEEVGKKLLSWRHSGFNVDNGEPVKREDKAGLERIAQYIVRNAFSEEKMIYNEEKQQVIYRAKFSKKSKRNFEVFEAEEFIAALTQHIPEKGLQLVRYYGWYSNKSRGARAKQQGIVREELSSAEKINISDYVPRKVASKQWRALIQKIWEVDPLECPSCGGEMRIISIIQEQVVIEKILRHVQLWLEVESEKVRGSPAEQVAEMRYELLYDDMSCPAGEEQASGY